MSLELGGRCVRSKLGEHFSTNADVLPKQKYPLLSSIEWIGVAISVQTFATP